MGDPQRMSQILIKLVSNAIKFSDEGVIQIKAVKMGENLRIAVSDQGIGMSKEDAQSIFDTFTQGSHPSKAKQQGTGLGLSITKKLIELQGGKIWVDSAPGKGSVFTFELPLQEVENFSEEQAFSDHTLKEKGRCSAACASWWLRMMLLIA